MRRNTENFMGRNYKKTRESDKISSQRRSKVMSKIRSKNTKFENDFVSYLEERLPKKHTFHLNDNSIKGKPDIVFDKIRVCVFLDSDFWHGWYYPKWRHLLKNDFWREKIEKNRTRDAKNKVYLKRQGWKVLRYWEHQIIKDIDSVVSDITDHLGSFYEK